MEDGHYGNRQLSDVFLENGHDLYQWKDQKLSIPPLELHQKIYGELMLMMW